MRVIVVGGGIGGLFCAMHLARREHDVTVLEKGEYWGGRLYTMPAGYEAGGARFHTGHRRLRRLLRSFRLGSIPIPGVPSMDWRQLQSLCVEPATDVTAPLPPSPALKAVQGYLGYEGEFQLSHAAEMQRVVCDDLTRLHYYLVDGGFSALVAKVQKRTEKYGGKTRLKADVTRVEEHGTGFRVHLGEKVLEADRVVLAVPPSVVAKLYPAAPDLDRLISTPLFRIYATWSTPWWTDQDKQVDPELGWIIPAGPNVLMAGYTDGDKARAWKELQDQEGDEALQALVMRRLQTLFPGRCTEPPQTVTYHYWPEGVHFFRPRSDTRTDAELVRQWTQTPVALVGEAFSTQHAWVEGALASACSALKTMSAFSTKAE